MSEVLEGFSLAGRRALVTGGTSGIGFMMARGLAGAGARVTITGRAAETCEARAKEISEVGECDFLVADLGAADGVEGLAAAVRSRIPDLDVLVNNAGITAHAPFGEYPRSHWDEVLDLNLKAPFLLTQALHPILKANATAARPSHVINTGSVAGLVHTTPDSYAYGPSKAALHHVTRVLARKLAPEHVHVNAIAPGLFPSKMSAWIMDDAPVREASAKRIPAGRFGEEKDVAALVVYLVSSSYLTGTVIPLDGGLSL